MLVVDASAAVELLLNRPAATDIARHIADHAHDLHAPHLIDIEVLSAVRRLVVSGAASQARAGEAVADLVDLTIERYPHDALVPRVWELRDNLSPYDGAYLALAEALSGDGASLLTADVRFARAARAHDTVDVLVAP